MPQPYYTFCTLQQATQELANRLYDSGMVFWSYQELVLYIQESLRTFNCYAQYWRGDFTFDSITDAIGYGDGGYGDGGYGGDSGTGMPSTWYDLSLVSNSLRPYIVTDFDIYTIVEYHLLEPATGPVWTGTQMFTMDDLTASLNRRWDEILSVSGCTITNDLVPALPGQLRKQLNDVILDVRRIAWFPTPVSDQDPAPSNVLWQEDIWSFQAFESPYTTQEQGTPFTYSLSSQPPMTFDVDVPPQQEGNYELLTVNASNYAFDATKPTQINIPADFCWILKWGVLADLFAKESEAKDVMRAAYCNHRYQQGLKLLASSPALLQLKINNAVPIWIDSVKNADEYSTDWQNQTPAMPESVFAAGLNLIALSPEPDQSYSATATVLQNAPVPFLPSDFVQVGRDDYDVIIDYAQHLALFKNGGQEFARTKDLYSRFLHQAAVYNSKLQEMGEFKTDIYGSSQREEITNPRLTKSLETADDGE